MKVFLLCIAALGFVACSDKSEKNDAEAKKHFNEMYKTPPPSDRTKDKGF